MTLAERIAKRPVEPPRIPEWRRRALARELPPKDLTWTREAA